MYDVTSASVATSKSSWLRRAVHAPRRAVHEVIRLRQRHVWNVIAHGFARPVLDRWGFRRDVRTDGINRMRIIAGLTPSLLKYRPGDVPGELWSPRRINYLVAELHLRSYLEIGVLEGETFANVTARRRYGVDPAPRFDAVFLPRRAKFAVMTSDAFFTSIHPWVRFDVAFIDGLHTFEQTYRDLINTLSRLRVGVIVIDDTVPSDEYSAIPNQVESFRARDEAGLAGRPWHGDVWRVVTLLDRCHGELQWRTVVDEGNPQTLVWRRRGAKVTPASAHEIAHAKRVTYAEAFADGIPSYFHPTSESVALAECVQSLRR